jgi:hypothetical protein
MVFGEEKRRFCSRTIVDDQSVLLKEIIKDRTDGKSNPGSVIYACSVRGQPSALPA